MPNPLSTFRACNGRATLMTLALGGSLLAARVQAQAASPAAREHELPAIGASRATPRIGEGRSSAAREETLVITGTVRARDRSPVRGAAVSADGTGSRATTDTTGAFVLRVPATDRREIRLRVARIGYATNTVTLSVTGSRLDAAISLNGRTPMGCGSLILVTADDRDHTKQRQASFPLLPLFGTP